MRGIRTSTRDINKIKGLREKGLTISEIKLVTGKSKSLISGFIKGVDVLPKFRESWLSKRGGSVARARRQLEEARKIVVKDISKIGTSEKMLIAACLYWGEGTKSDFSISNSDPILIRTFVTCLREFGIPKERLRVTVRIYDDIDKQSAMNYWAKIIGIPVSGILNVNILDGKKKGKLPYGMCRVRVTKGGFLLKMLKSIQQIIAESM